MENYRTMAKTYRKAKEQPSLTPKELEQVQRTFESQEKEIIAEMTEDPPEKSLEAIQKRNMARMVAREMSAADLTEYLSNL